MTNPLMDFDVEKLIEETQKWMCAWCREPVFGPPYTELNWGQWRVHGKCWRPFKRGVHREQRRNEKRVALRFAR